MKTISQELSALGRRISLLLGMATIVLLSAASLVGAYFFFSFNVTSALRGLDGQMASLVQMGNIFELERLVASLNKGQIFDQVTIFDDEGKVRVSKTSMGMNEILATRMSYTPNKGYLQIHQHSLLLSSHADLLDEGNRKIGSIVVWKKIPVEQIALILLVVDICTLAGLSYLRQRLNKIALALISPIAEMRTAISEIQSLDQHRMPEELRGKLKYREIIDVTERFYGLLFELNIKENEIKTMQKQAAVGQIVDQVAHDIRSPLAALSMASRTLEMQSEDRGVGSGPTVEIQKLMQASVKRIQDILADLKRRESVAPQNLDEPTLLWIAIEEIISEKRATLSQSIKVHLQVDHSNCNLVAKIPPHVFKRIMSNILQNSFEALGKGGNVQITILEKLMKLIVTVTDNGKGIPENILLRLGSIGVTHGKEGGSGLGISHAKNSLKELGGDLQVASRVSQGTVVNIEVLPYGPYFEKGTQLVLGKKILLIDDDLHFCNEMRSRMPSKSFFTCVSSHEDFINVDKSEFDIVYCDLNLGPQWPMSGIEILTNHFKEKQRIFLTDDWTNRALLSFALTNNLRIIPKACARYMQWN